jgi:hypothetical protein
MNILTYKKDFGDTSYYKLDYLKMKSMKCKGFVLPNHIPHPRVISEERKNAICRNLLSIIPQVRHGFWQNLPVNDSAVDLRFTDED